MKRGMAWPVAVVGILSLTICANVWLIRLANTDPSFAVEEDYYQRGVHWDDELAQRARNVALGWTLATSVSDIHAGRGAELQIVLTDSARLPIGEASVLVRAIHVARAGNPVEIRLTQRGAGEYEALVPIERAGLWELRIDIHRGSDRFTATERLNVRSDER